MANKPQDNLLKQNNDLTLTGKAVLVQNQLGIFYGILEKADTRDGTVLLSDGYMLSPERHITYARYLDFLDETIEDALYTALQYDDEGDDIDSNPAELLKEKYNSFKEMFSDGKNIEIIISSDTFDEHQSTVSITDYASGGVALVNKRTAEYANTSHLQETSRLLSLTNILAIVPVSDESYGDRFVSIIAGRDDVAGILFKHFKLENLYNLSTLSTFTAISDSHDISPRLVVNTPQREEKFKKRDDNVVIPERLPQSRFIQTDDDGNQIDLTAQVIDSVLNTEDPKSNKA